MRLKSMARIVMAGLAASAAGYACGGTNPSENAPASVVLSPSSITLNAIGDTETLTATVRDALGNVVEATVEFSSTDIDIFTIAPSGTATATGLGEAKAVASLGSLADTTDVSVIQVGSVITRASGDGQSAEVATTLPDALVIRITDASSNPVADIDLTFSVTGGGGSVSVTNATTDANGEAQTMFTLGTTAGSVHTVRAVAGGVGQTQFTATGLAAAPVSAQIISGDNQLQPVSTTLPVDLVVKVSDQFGNGVPDQDVNYAVQTGGGSVAPVAAKTDGVGEAHAQWTLGSPLGAQTLDADVLVLPSVFNFTATGTDLTVTSVTPSPLVEGQAAQAIGTGFDLNVNSIFVSVDGASAQITASTTTTIDFVVPQTPCRPARDVPVVVTTTTGGTAPPVTNPLNPGAFVSLAVGDFTVVADPADFCFQFDAEVADQVYLLGVQSMTTGTGLTSASVRGAVLAGSSAFRSTVVPQLLAPSGGRRYRFDSAREARWRLHREAEAVWREAELQMLEPLARQLRARGLRSTRSAQAQSQSAVPGTVQVGDIVALRMPSFGGSCNDFANISATVKAKGARGIWLNDNQNAGGGFSNADYLAMSDQFDNFIFDTDTSFFGASTDLDGNDRLVVLVSKKLNDDTQFILGFVSPRDMFPTTSCPASNEGEIYYGRAPDASYSRDAAFKDALPLIAHEFTHVIQVGRRFVVNQEPFMSSYMAEGQATLAEEVAGHAALGQASLMNYGFVRAFNSDDADDHDWYIAGLSDIAFYFGANSQSASSRISGAPHECSWLRSDPDPCRGRPLWYGVTWSLLRWVNDQLGPSYVGGEKAIQRAIVNNNITGLANLEDVLGEPLDPLMAEWAATLYLDDRFGGMPARLRFPSWNLRDIYEGGNLFESARLVPFDITFSSFTETVDVRGSSAAYYLLSGASRPATAVRVRDRLDGQLPGFMQVFLVRVQ
ncbi:MAG: hypothetical protein O7I93_08435 [Gemmatimonadetes bacterium]|nr:hypothetical protein [Gemmatimonadota bacterium]